MKKFTVKYYYYMKIAAKQKCLDVCSSLHVPQVAAQPKFRQKLLPLWLFGATITTAPLVHQLTPQPDNFFSFHFLLFSASFSECLRSCDC